MKKTFALVVTVVLLLMLGGAAAGEGFTQPQQLLFDTVRYCTDLPKDAQVLAAAEYYCKVEGHPLRLMLIRCTQNEHISSLFGDGAGCVVLDVDTGELVTYATFQQPEGMPASKSDAVHMIYNCFVSAGMNGDNFLYADHEMLFFVQDAEIESVNAALQQLFLR